jgi:pimeloyl-ACP methyl ester carboxylesterase
MDRRGHGLSDFGACGYCIDREYEDVIAVLSCAGKETALIGHSFGAICCLGAAMLKSLPRLVLYEPPLPLQGLIAGRNLAPYCHAMRDGRFDEALEIGLKEFIRLPVNHVESMRATSAWSRLSSLMSAWPRELSAMDALADNVEKYAAITCPTLLVRGSRSPKHPFRNAVSALYDSLPNALVVDLDGHGHLGLRSAPALLAQQVSHFLSA